MAELTFSTRFPRSVTIIWPCPGGGTASRRSITATIRPHPLTLRSSRLPISQFLLPMHPLFRCLRKPPLPQPGDLPAIAFDVDQCLSPPSILGPRDADERQGNRTQRKLNETPPER